MKIGIDLGGTKTEIICLDQANNTLYRHRVASPQQSYQATIETIKQLIETAEEELKMSGSVGVGIPGSICQFQHTVKNANTTWLNGQPLLNDLQIALNRDVKVENDADCFAQSEFIDGAAKGKRNAFCVIIGTGCGGGLIIDSNIVKGVNGLGGEWGHNPLPFPTLFSDKKEKLTDFFDKNSTVKTSSIYSAKPEIDHHVETIELSEFPGTKCYCGKRGCLETWISGTGFENDYYRVTDNKLSAKEIVAQAKQGEVEASACFDRYCERLAKSLSQVINSIDPEVIVLGGGMSNVDAIYSEVPKRWDKYVFSDQESRTQLVKAVHGDSSGVRGAAFLWESI
jgi:fructokinase